MKKLIISQFVVLLLGTIFAWANFVWELVAWLNSEPCPTGCVISAEPVNPFLTPCFYGALFFLTAFILSFFILRKFNKTTING